MQKLRMWLEHPFAFILRIHRTRLTQITRVLRRWSIVFRGPVRARLGPHESLGVALDVCEPEFQRGELYEHAYTVQSVQITLTPRSDRGFRGSVPRLWTASGLVELRGRSGNTSRRHRRRQGVPRQSRNSGRRQERHRSVDRRQPGRDQRGSQARVGQEGRRKERLQRTVLWKNLPLLL